MTDTSIVKSFKAIDERDKTSIVVSILDEGYLLLKDAKMSEADMRAIFEVVHETIVSLFGSVEPWDGHTYRRLQVYENDIRVSMREIFSFGAWKPRRDPSESPVLVFSMVREAIERGLSWILPPVLLKEADYVVFALHPKTSAWAAVGFGPDDWRKWDLFGFTPQEAAEWSALQVPLAEAVRWKKIGSSKYEEWKPIVHESEAEIGQVEEWIRNGISLKIFTKRVKQKKPNKPLFIEPTYGEWR